MVSRPGHGCITNHLPSTGAQQKELDAQKELVAKQVQDNTKLHVGHYVQRTQQRDVEKKAEMAKFYNPHIKR